MKKTKLYNVIFPIWFLIFFPPVILLTLAGNFAIDSLVVIICFFVFKLGGAENNLKVFYTRSISKVWGFGFLADISGASILFTLGIFGHSLGLSDAFIYSISYDPFSSIAAVLTILFSMLVSSFLIFVFNYKFTFKKLIEEKALRFKAAITIAIVTIPWTFLLPTKTFYHLF